MLKGWRIFGPILSFKKIDPDLHGLFVLFSFLTKGCDGRDEEDHVTLNAILISLSWKLDLNKIFLSVNKLKFKIFQLNYHN